SPWPRQDGCARPAQTDAPARTSRHRRVRLSHTTLIRCSLSTPELQYNPSVLVDVRCRICRPAVVQIAKSFETLRDDGVNCDAFPQTFPQRSRKSSTLER